MEPFAGHEQEFLEVLSALYALMEQKGYSRDMLLRDHKLTPQYIHIRHWTSEQARLEAREDPDVHRCWLKLGNFCHMRRVHEALDEVDWKAAAASTPAE
jgi:hypothetical protein